jgi:uncharacterized membrane protein
MVGVWCALGSAICYGVADFAGGMLSRRANAVAIALAGQVGGLLLTVLAALLVPAPDIAADDLAWGAASGVGTGMGMAFLYRGLSQGAMSVVVPVSAVGGLALPVAANVAILGDRPSTAAWLGLVAAVPAMWCVSRTRTDETTAGAAGVADGLAASLGIALQYLALAQAGTASGLWPLAVGRLAAVLAILPLAGMTRSPLRLPPWLAVQAGLVGGVAALALFLYLIATRHALVTVAVALSNFYPALPALLGIVVLRERLSHMQVGGLLLAGVAVGLLSAI